MSNENHPWKVYLNIVFVFIASVLFVHSELRAQFSPGELSRGHQNLEGTQNCTKCHEVGSEISGMKCLSCHEEIQREIDVKRGFHFSTSAKKCVACHKEHLGREASTVLFDEKTFDHAQTGFVLNGKHAAATCKQCHGEKLIHDPIVKKKLDQFPHDTYLGLAPACVSCHTDPHNGKFKQECSSCHSTVAWNVVKNFDHSATRFPLEGLHGKVACSKCHPSITASASKDSVSFTTQSFSDCTPCHTSPHVAKFVGRDCKTCHTPVNWSAAMEKPFDHNVTAYKLIGKHSSVKCAQCHHVERRQNFTATFFLPYSKCMNCHEDKHHGEFQARYKNDCTSCHSEFGFKPSKFTLARHTESKFALTGGHTATACASCHFITSTSTLTFHWNNLTCETCHKDVHRGQFTKQMEGQSCGKCHTTDGWNATSFDHSKTQFPLTGKHVTVACVECHTQKPGSGTLVLRYDKIPTDCQSCHKDVHQDQFAENGKTACSSCHTSASWQSLTFNHDTQSKFSLAGAHAKVSCGECHHKETMGTAPFIRFKPLSALCESCHQTKVKQ